MDSGSDYSSSPSESVYTMSLPCDVLIMEEEISQRLQILKGKSSEISISLQSHPFISPEWGELMDVTTHTSFREMMQTVITETEGLLRTVLIQELNIWKEEQSRYTYMDLGVRKKSIDLIENWCEDLAEIVWKTFEQLQEAERAGVLEITPLQLRAKALVEELVRYSLVVVDQPLPVVKKGTKFPKTITLRFLCSSIFRYLKIDLSKSENQPTVEMSLINDVQACYLSENNTRPTKVSGSIQKYISKLEYQPKASPKVSALFRCVKISKVDENDRKRSGSIVSPKTDAVTDTKFCLHFYCEFPVANFHFKASTMSSPLVVVTHGSQDSQAWATINWDTAFHELNRLPFSTPPKITWLQLSELLNCRFKAATEGQGLSQENLMYLKERISNIGSPSPSEVISWTRFCKSIIPERNFSFWDWFYANMKLTERVAKRYWNEGYIKGFISKTEAEEMIAPCPPGTFLLRFSETMLGGISIVFTDTDGSVNSYAPFTKNQLCSKSLADTLKDFEDLHFLYPRTPKAVAFGKYYSKDKVTTIPASQGKGYVIVCPKYVPASKYSSSPEEEPMITTQSFIPNQTGSLFTSSLSSITANIQNPPAHFAQQCLEEESETMMIL